MVKRSIIIIAFFLLVPQFTFAVDLGTGPGSLAQQVGQIAAYDTNATADSLPQMIGKIIQVALSFVGTIFFALAVYAGFLWMTAQGNAEQVEKATGIIKTAVIGMIIVTAAYSITAFALIFSSNSGKFGGNGGGGGGGGGGGRTSGPSSGVNYTCIGTDRTCVLASSCPSRYGGGRDLKSTCADDQHVCCLYDSTCIGSDRVCAPVVSPTDPCPSATYTGQVKDQLCREGAACCVIKKL